MESKPKETGPPSTEENRRTMERVSTARQTLFSDYLDPSGPIQNGVVVDMSAGACAFAPIIR